MEILRCFRHGPLNRYRLWGLMYSTLKKKESIYKYVSYLEREGYIEVVKSLPHTTPGQKVKYYALTKKGRIQLQLMESNSTALLSISTGYVKARDQALKP